VIKWVACDEVGSKHISPTTPVRPINTTQSHTNDMWNTCMYDAKHANTVSVSEHTIVLLK